MKTETLKHTPGPWTAGGKANLYGGKYPVFANYNEGTNLTPGREDIATVLDERNVHLIAAAPELLACLKELLVCTELNLDEMESDTIEAISKAENAIAKAEGK